METNNENADKREKATPIIDGDARPDMNIHGDEPEQPKDHPIEIPYKKNEKGKAEEKVTSQNRDDKNSLEDFKDAMLE